MIILYCLNYRCEKTCPPNTYGLNCTETCDCYNGAGCSHEDGTCICAPGFTGQRCENRGKSYMYTGFNHGIVSVLLYVHIVLDKSWNPWPLASVVLDPALKGKLLAANLEVKSFLNSLGFRCRMASSRQVNTSDRLLNMFSVLDNKFSED